MIADGTPIVFISDVPGRALIQVVQAFAIGNTAVSGVKDGGDRSMMNWGKIRDEDEGVRWARGHTGPAVDALRVALALRDTAGKRIFEGAADS